MVGLPTPESGMPKLGWLKALNICTANCKPEFLREAEPLSNRQILIHVSGSSQIGKVARSSAEGECRAALQRPPG